MKLHIKLVRPLEFNSIYLFLIFSARVGGLGEAGRLAACPGGPPWRLRWWRRRTHAISPRPPGVPAKTCAEPTRGAPACRSTYSAGHRFEGPAKKHCLAADSRPARKLFNARQNSSARPSARQKQDDNSNQRRQPNGNNNDKLLVSLSARLLSRSLAGPVGFVRPRPSARIGGSRLQRDGQLNWRPDDGARQTATITASEQANKIYEFASN